MTHPRFLDRLQLRRAAPPPAAPAPGPEPIPLELLRRRVTWQAEAAYGGGDAVPADVPLWRLESLVDRHAPAHPERAAEWRATLFRLREHARPDGELPPAFRPLVLATFGELLREH